MSQRFPLLLLVSALVLVACSGPPQTAGQSGPSAESDPEPEREVPVDEYETFDASEYVVRAPETAVEVTHRVPARLMRGRADEGVKRTIQGFRVQVFSALDKQASQEFREQVHQWWKTNKEDAPSVFGDKPPIVVMYSQPYYRVRIGAFAQRNAAEQALQFVQRKYPNAFIARSTVTVTE